MPHPMGSTSRPGSMPALLEGSTLLEGSMLLEGYLPPASFREGSSLPASLHEGSSLPASLYEDSSPPTSLCEGSSPRPGSLPHLERSLFYPEVSMLLGCSTASTDLLLYFGMPPSRPPDLLQRFGQPPGH